MAQQKTSHLDLEHRIRQLESENAKLRQLIVRDAHLSAERDLRSVLDNMPSMIGYWDSNQRNRFGNYAYFDWFGVAPAAMPGKHIREVIGEERYRHNLPYIEAALRGEPQQFERTILSPDGKTVRHALANYIPDIVGGEVLGFYALVTDITAIKKVEEALRISEARYRSVVEAQTDVISRLRADGSFLFVNEAYCRFFGKSAAELIGNAWMPVCHPDDLPRVREQLALLAPERPWVIIENRVYAADDRLHWMQFANRGFFDTQGNLTEIQSVGRDITDRKLAELALQDLMQNLEQRVAERTQELRQLTIETTLVEERERRAVARDLHDDLGQRLHIVLLKLDALSKRHPELVAATTELRSEITHASQIVRSLISQLSPTVLRDLGLLAALRWLGEEMERTHGLNVEFTSAVTVQPILTEAQSAILFRAVRELLFNVVRHAGTMQAAIDVKLADSQFVIAVADRGSGCHGKEYGFGLTTIHERISFLGGSMKVFCRTRGGTRVELSLPIT